MSRGHHENNDSDHGRNRGMRRHSPVAGIDNWRRSDLPYRQKLRLVMRNNLAKLRNRSSCCGHAGEPGC